MIQFLLAAHRSGSGKTTMTCALLMALKRRGCAPCAFKSGPDLTITPGKTTSHGPLICTPGILCGQAGGLE